MRTLSLTCLVSFLLLLPTFAHGEKRPVLKERDRPAQPAAAPPQRTPERPAEPEGGRDREGAPGERVRVETRRAEAVEARHRGHALAQLGREARDPLPLIAAAQIAQRTPPPRPLAQAKSEETAAPGAVPPRTARPLAAPDGLQAQALLREARALAAGHPLEREALAMLDRLAAAEVVSRGTALGPQSTCDSLGGGGRLTYHIAYEGGERAALGISGAGAGAIAVTVHDEEGRLVSRTQDRPLITWSPRWRAIFRVELENRTPQRVEFCLETN